MRTRAHSRRVRRLALAVLAAVATLAATVGFGAPSAQAASPDPTTKFTAVAEQQLSTQKTADFWVRLADKADLSAASSIKDWDARGRAVHDISEVPVFTANVNTIVVEHGGGDLTVELVPRKAMDSPTINTLKVQERADL